ncbi:Sigma-W factor [Anaerohalosphaera lusitana]|uniref:Sigma-W factor n=1 Tax=Anaerohalosphaera lusitana TaxID=1936003 RepID=A0A1U9NPR0_9BACT|nr:sigma-70 family RNA polymerase sigma factor [Anaerohalosphaera lusitana]AQT69922.1 Sigma-W factor [Anaerohalosphaera lusitana]
MDAVYESALVERACGGDERAWAVLFRGHFGPVYSFVLGLVRGRVDDAEEVTQQTFITAAKKLHRFDSERGGFRAWLFGIARNCCRKHVSKRSPVVYDSQTVEAGADRGDEFSHKRLVLETLARLPGHYRTVLEAKYFHKRSVAELAAEMDASERAIESRLTRAREKFKSVYQGLAKEEFCI